MFFPFFAIMIGSIIDIKSFKQVLLSEFYVAVIFSNLRKFQVWLVVETQNILRIVIRTITQYYSNLSMVR